jgi:hypothetical protein
MVLEPANNIWWCLSGTAGAHRCSCAGAGQVQLFCVLAGS